MRICIMTVGSRGDVQPYVALGVGLQAAGHDVCLVTHAIFEQFIRSYGLDFYPIAGNPQELIKELIAAGGNFLQLVRECGRLAREMMLKVIDDTLIAAQHADLIIASSVMVYTSYTVAEKLSIPSLCALLQPILRTKAFPTPLFPVALPLGGPSHLLSHYLADQMFWQFTRTSTNTGRRQLGVQPFPWHGPYRQLIKQDYPFLCGYSQHVIPKPADWGSRSHVTGYWFLNAHTSWQPPARLVDFLQAGPAPVYIGFGSMRHNDAGELTEIALQALKKSGQRGILMMGWGGLRNVELPQSVLKLEEAPHDWLFPRMAAVVHHGGAGTTAAGFRAGVPSIVIPFFADQFFWGRRAFRLGVGPGPIPQKRLSAEHMAAAITRAINDQSMRARAQQLGEDIRAENGVAAAVQIIEKFCSVGIPM